METKWIEIIPNVDPAFKTHSNYVRYLSGATENIEFFFTNTLNKTFTEDKELTKKVKLTDITLDNLYEEMNTINKLHEYAIVCSSWVSVKSYYVIFNLLIILNYLVCCDRKALMRPTHLSVNQKFKTNLTDGVYTFSNPIFNSIYCTKEVHRFRFQSGINLKNEDKSRHLQIVKKLYEYTKDDYKRQLNLMSLRGGKKATFEKNTKICLFEFFYWYRIKANYRDLEYLEADVKVEDFYNYYSNYYKLIVNVSTALKNEINRLSKIRLSKTLF